MLDAFEFHFGVCAFVVCMMFFVYGQFGSMLFYPERDDSVRECDEKFIMSPGADLFSHVVIAFTRMHGSALHCVRSD